MAFCLNRLKAIYVTHTVPQIIHSAKAPTKTVSAKALVLDLLRMAYPMPLPVGLLVTAGGLFGITSNVLRVNITRLLGKGQIEQDDRGFYRLGSESMPHERWLSQWQGGESRVKDWEGDWLVLNSAASLKVKDAKAIYKMASYFGFRELLSGVWIRPNNLRQSLGELSLQISELAQQTHFVIFESHDLCVANKRLDVKVLAHELWSVRDLEKDYKKVIKQLERGIARASSLQFPEAFKESYLVGAEVHHRMALDPLLPQELVNAELRQDMVELFAEYDANYRGAWNNFIRSYFVTHELPPETMRADKLDVGLKRAESVRSRAL